jgi:hypothetical protein
MDGFLGELLRKYAELGATGVVANKAGETAVSGGASDTAGAGGAGASAGDGGAGGSAVVAVASVPASEAEDMELDDEELEDLAAKREARHRGDPDDKLNDDEKKDWRRKQEVDLKQAAAYRAKKGVRKSGK